ncbi:hypothetical protein IT570_13655 [Candidatus Sumerlaeota bacterium]|nr:hypothetical protein [Candidatus Sumerlaeota bacterium]
MSSPDPNDQKAEALRRMNEKIEAQKKGAGAAKAPAPSPASPPPVAPQRGGGGASPPRAREVMAARAAAAREGDNPTAPSTPTPTASTIDRGNKDMMAAFNERNAGARILQQESGLPGQAPAAPNGFRTAIIAAIGLVVLLGGYKAFSLYTTSTLEKDKARATNAPTGASAVVIPEPEVAPDGHLIYPDVPYQAAEVIPTGPGIQYGNATGHLNMDMVQVGILNGAGEIEYVRGDDPRAKAAMEEAQNDARSAELAEETIIKANTRPSENHSDRTVELPKNLTLTNTVEATPAP